ncbi:flavodoxin domain-containing protein [Kribbella sp. NBC_00889]|uniref:flavodoxin domain-containing protein n=1 Tax=Kribbella sp. NBC_00889 TaxID=2975974 RepID=UPI00386CADA5|nr:flavodoxin domain-containing protein [Kribbella sp. NBC_00889]
MSRRVLVAYASKMGATAEIAEGMGAEIRQHGHLVDVLDVRQVRSITKYDAVVLGSAIYTRRWRSEAVHFLRKYADALRTRQVWLFHSGPVGPHADQPQAMPKNVLRLAERVGATPAVTFPGRLELETAKGFLARRMAVTELGGDVRDWDLVGAWANDVAEAISSVEISSWPRLEPHLEEIPR